MLVIFLLLYGSKKMPKMNGRRLTWLNAWKTFWLIAAIFSAIFVFNLLNSRPETRRQTISAPLTPSEFVLEAGESSPVFMLRKDGAWHAYLDPCKSILPYVVRINTRTVQGTLYFDGYKIVNTSSEILVFKTWQKRAGGNQQPRVCDS
ncbi:hypothetical protein COB87_002070 [Candidatus Wolfebacteria bacterium]|nr:hypothetical protein [Candidatus Wolfebacteria bacterium]